MTIFKAKEAFSYTDRHGVPRVVTPGTLMSDDDPGFKGRERLFEPVDVSVERDAARREGREAVAPPPSETASADPGTLRSTGIGRAGRRAGAKVAADIKADAGKGGTDA